MIARPSTWLTIGVVFFGLSASTIIGWWYFGASRTLGEPIYQTRMLTVYQPWSAVDWWMAWGDNRVFRSTYTQGLMSSAILSFLVAAMGLHIARSFGPLPHVASEEQPDRFGTLGELLKSKRISVREKGIVLGRSGSRIVYHTGDDHVLLVGASRVGEKGVSFVLPTLADCPDSMIVFDPKHELFEATADERSKRGPVYLFDPTRPGTHRFNPLLELRDDERNIGDCRALGMLMTHGMAGRDPFWATKAADLGAAIIRVVCTDGGPRTLKRAREISIGIASGKPPLSCDQYAMEIINEHLSRPADRGVRPGVDAQLSLALASAGDPVAASATADSDFTVADLCAGPRPVTVYITLPASQSDSLRSLARIVLQTMLLGMLHDRRFASDGRQKTRRVVLLLDEFPALGHLPFIENGLAVMAGYNTKAMLVAQSIEQIKESYGPNESIVGNVGTFIWVPSFSKGTYEELTATAGTLVAAMRARHRKVGIVDRPSETVSQSRHPVLNPRELQTRSRDEVLVFHAGARPTWLEKCRWYQHPAYRGRVKSTDVNFHSGGTS